MKLDKEMSELETKASLNIAESKENIEFDLKLLDGFSDKYKLALVEKRSVPNKKGFIFLGVGKKSSGLIASMDNPEARKIF
jgi:hypothetical protein